MNHFNNQNSLSQMNAINNSILVNQTQTQQQSQAEINELMAKVLLECQQAMNNSQIINHSINQFYSHHNVQIDEMAAGEHDETNETTARRETKISNQLKQLQSQSWDNMSAGLLSKPVRAIISGSSIVSMDT